MYGKLFEPEKAVCHSAKIKPFKINNLAYFCSSTKQAVGREARFAKRLKR